MTSKDYIFANYKKTNTEAQLLQKPQQYSTT